MLQTKHDRFVTLAFILTWWITIPVGCLAGAVYTNVTENAVNAT